MLTCCMCGATTTAVRNTRNGTQTRHFQIDFKWGHAFRGACTPGNAPRRVLSPYYIARRERKQWEKLHGEKWRRSCTNERLTTHETMIYDEVVQTPTAESTNTPYTHRDHAGLQFRIETLPEELSN